MNDKKQTYKIIALVIVLAITLQEKIYATDSVVPKVRVSQSHQRRKTTAKNKVIMKNEVNGISADGGTNLWEGTHQGFKTLKILLIRIKLIELFYCPMTNPLLAYKMKRKISRS